MNSSDSVVSQFFRLKPSGVFSSGVILIDKDSIVKDIRYIQSGYVLMYRKQADGTCIMMHVFRPGSFFPLTAVLGTKNSRYTYRTLTETTLHTVPISVFTKTFESDHALWGSVTKRLLRGIDGLLTRIELLMTAEAPKSLSSFLYYLATQFGTKKNDGISIDLPMTHKDFADWLGLTRETVSLQYGKLKKAGIIEKEGKHFIIKNIPKLKDLSQ